MAVRVDQMMGVNELKNALSLITYNASKAWRAQGYGVEEGKEASLLVLNAEHELDALRLLGPPLYVVRKGKIVAKNR